MANILSLDELLKVDDLRDYGLKTEGLIKLKKFLSSFNPADISIQYPIDIPSFFAVPVNADLNSSQLADQYFSLTKEFNSPKIILARSSDPEEMPGQFETHFSFFNPSDIKQSFQNWMIAAKKVQESGAKALIGQPLVGELEDFYHDVDYVHDNNGSDFTKTRTRIKSFGGSNSSFVGRSHSIIRGSYPSITTCAGLASKIVRGDKDVCVLQKGLWRYDVINLNHNYEMESFSKLNQKTIDIVQLGNPDRVSTIKYHNDAQYFDLLIDRSILPFYDYMFSNREKGYYGFQPTDLLELISKIEKFIGRPVEIEGCVNDNGVHLWQLREYEIPQRHFQGLTEISDDQKILKTEKESIGFNQFNGDLILSEKISDYEEGSIFFYQGMIDVDNLSKFQNCKQLIFPMIQAGGLYEAAHSFGYTAQVIVELDKIGVRAIALGDDLHNLNWLLRNPAKSEKISQSKFKMKNVTVECDGDNAQIYFNNAF